MRCRLHNLHFLHRIFRTPQGRAIQRFSCLRAAIAFRVVRFRTAFFRLCNDSCHMWSARHTALARPIVAVLLMRTHKINGLSGALIASGRTGNCFLFFLCDAG
jgi:hypothetical protein